MTISPVRRVRVEPKPKDQYNFTDPASRIMFDHTKKTFEQSYNCQAAVDARISGHRSRQQ